MKFVIALLALASVASARKLDLVLDGQTSSYTNVLAKQIAPLLLQRQSLLNYRTIPIALNQARVVSAPQIYTVAAPVQTAAVQTVAAAPTIQVVRAAAPAVQYVQAAPVATGPITAAVQTQHSVQVVDVPSSGSVAAPQTVVIGPSVQPLAFEFQSQSSPISVRQSHIPGQPNPPQFSSHQDEPDLLKQEIVKPIIHEVTEAVQPFRKITQEVRPVQETINQLITRGQQVQTVQAAPVQTVAVQAAPVQTVAVQAAPVQTIAVQAAPAVVETVAAAPAASSVEVVEEPVISTVVAEAAPVAVETVATEALPAGNLRTLPVTASIIRYRK